MAKKKKATAVTVVSENKPEIQKQDSGSVMALINNAVAQGASVETMERLFELHEKVQASNARKSFAIAMSNLQEELPVVKKLKQGDKAAYAPLEDIAEMTKGYIKKHGFTYRWNTSQTERNIKVICIATHVDGHSEETEMTSEVEETVTGKTSGQATKSAPQRTASTITFLKRYTFVNMFGISVANEDFDGRMEKQTTSANKEKSKPLSDKVKIMHLLKVLGIGTEDSTVVKEEIERLTGIIVSDDKNELKEIVSRLEVLVKEKNENEG